MCPSLGTRVTNGFQRFEKSWGMYYDAMLAFKGNAYSKTVNNRTGGANNEYRGGPGGPGNGFCGPGGEFFHLISNSGLPLLLFPLKPLPGPRKPHLDLQDRPGTRSQLPPVRLLSVLEYSIGSKSFYEP